MAAKTRELTLDPTRFADVVATSLYPLPAVAELFAVNTKTIASWIAAGKIKAQKRPFSNRRVIYGADILVVAAPLLASLPTVKHARPESQSQREARAAKAMAAIESM